MDYVVMDYIVMDYFVMAYIVMAYVVMANIAMARGIFATHKSLQTIAEVCMGLSHVHMHTAMCIAICEDMCGACSRILCHQGAEEQLETM